MEVVDILSSNATWAHNICSFDSGLIICNSKDGSLYELFSGETIWKANENDSLTRGLAVAGDYLFIGKSKKADRKDRKWMTGGVWIIDRKSLRTLDFLEMPGSGEVYEIRVIGSLDDGHNNEVIKAETISAITRVSQIVTSAYQLRRTHPAYQRDWLPLSIAVRSVQMAERWRNWTIRAWQNAGRQGMTK